MVQVNDTTTNMNGGATTAEPTYQSEFTFTQTSEHVPDVTSNFNFHQASHNLSIIPDTWILLDSQSTVSVFKNRQFLSNICPSTRTLRVHTKGGTQLSTQVGTVNNFGNVWYNHQSLANILSMTAVRKVCCITMNTSVATAIHVHCTNGTIITFQEYSSGLYYFDAGNSSNKTTNQQEAAYIF